MMMLVATDDACVQPLKPFQQQGKYPSRHLQISALHLVCLRHTRMKTPVCSDAFPLSSPGHSVQLPVPCVHQAPHPLASVHLSSSANFALLPQCPSNLPQLLLLSRLAASALHG